MSESVAEINVALPRPSAEQVVLAVAFVPANGDGVLVTKTVMERRVLESEHLGEALAQAVRSGIALGEQDVVMRDHAETQPLDTSPAVEVEEQGAGAAKPHETHASTPGSAHEPAETVGQREDVQAPPRTTHDVAPCSSPFGVDLFGEPINRPAGPLATRFVMPPFSVLDARGGEWQERKRAWLSMGISAGDGLPATSLSSGRGNTAEQAADLAERYGIDESKLSGVGSGVYTEARSVFDPVLCELVYKWWCPAGGSVLDPFSGESVKGIMAALLGLDYYGCELREEQVQTNRAQAERMGLRATWVQGDSALLEERMAEWAPYDLVFTSPPYYDLEVYSSADKDGSALPTYEAFMEWYGGIFAQAVRMMRDNRFLVVKVGEVRNKATGEYRNFVGDNITLFRSLGLKYYNEAVLVTPAGSLPVRMSAQFDSSRKVGKCHQNVLVFWKGETKEVRRVFAETRAARGD